MFILDGRKKLRLKGVQRPPQLLEEEVEESKLIHGFVVHAAVLGNAQRLTFLRYTACPFQAHRFTARHRRDSPGDNRDLGGSQQVAGFVMRKISVISQRASSLATKMLDLSRCSEADQRISGKLERR